MNNLLFPVRFSAADIDFLSDLLEYSKEGPIERHREISGIWLHNEDYSSELRLLILGKIQVTVSRVCFVHRRAGTMTKVLSFLKEFCREHGISKIVIQSVETHEMAAWCRKNQFIPNPNTTFPVNDLLVGDYVLEIEREV